MALFSSTGGTGDGGGERIPVAKYNAKAGRWYLVNRSNASGEWVTTEEEVTNFTAIIDLENLQIGWLYFASGQAPDVRVGPLSNPPPKPEGGKHKEGFRILMKMGAKCGGDVREFAATANCIKAGIEQLYADYQAGLEANPGKLPVVSMEKTLAIKSEGKDANGNKQSSTNFQPVFKIEKWLDRPAELVAPNTAKAAEVKAEPAKVEAAAATTDDGEEF